MKKIDVTRWPAAPQFHWFRTYERPHYAITTRLNASRLAAASGSPFRNVLWAAGMGLYKVEALRLRFCGDVVTLYDRVQLSPTLARTDGTFGFGYVEWQKEYAAFDAHAQEMLATTEAEMTSAARPDPRAALTYLSCLPWLDYTSLDNAMPNADDCIPRINWGKIMPKADGHDMAMTLQVHHALVHGRDIAAFFAATQTALDQLPTGTLPP